MVVLLSKLEVMTSVDEKWDRYFTGTCPEENEFCSTSSSSLFITRRGDVNPFYSAMVDLAKTSFGACVILYLRVGNDVYYYRTPFSSDYKLVELSYSFV